MWIITSHIPLTKPKQASRNALELLIDSNLANSKIFNGCTAHLSLAIWDTAACAQKIFGNSGRIGLADIHARERILVEVLSFQPEDGTKVDKDEQPQYASPLVNISFQGSRTYSDPIQEHRSPPRTLGPRWRILESCYYYSDSPVSFLWTLRTGTCSERHCILPD